MGSLTRFNLKSYIEDYDIKVAIETGLGWGHGIQHISSFPFEKIYSIEISAQVIEIAKRDFNFDDRVVFICDNSFNGLKKALSDIKDNCFIFLDAHFPNADLGLAGFNDEKNEAIKFPLLSEIEIIKKLRCDKGFRDVIIIDDLHFYTNEEFPESDNLRKANIILPSDSNCLDKIMDSFSETHTAKLFKESSGYGLFLPHEKS